MRHTCIYFAKSKIKNLPDFFSLCEKSNQSFKNSIDVSQLKSVFSVKVGSPYTFVVDTQLEATVALLIK